MLVSRNDLSPSIVSKPGRGIPPSGGTVPALSRRITFSPHLRFSGRVGEMGPVEHQPRRLGCVWLWHTTQYVSSTARREATDICPAGTD